MATRTANPYLLVLALLGLTSLALAFGVDISLTDQAGIRVHMPANLGAWAGDEMRYCSSNTCDKAGNAQFLVSKIPSRETCPVCKGSLHSLSIVERNLLPADTEGIKQRYTAPDGRQVLASIVLSGKERASIHRPEVCLSGQGSSIVKSQIVEIPVAGRAPLKVRVLELVHERKTEGGGTSFLTSYYAYWFAGKDRETPSHLQRMWWMASDRILHNLAHRWAYIAVAGIRKDGSGDYQKEIAEIISQLQPAISLK